MNMNVMKEHAKQLDKNRDHRKSMIFDFAKQVVIAGIGRSDFHPEQIDGLVSASFAIAEKMVSEYERLES